MPELKLYFYQSFILIHGLFYSLSFFDTIFYFIHQTNSCSFWYEKSQFSIIKAQIEIIQGRFSSNLVTAHLKCKSPVPSNSTVGMTLAMNFRKISKAKWLSTFWLFSLIVSDMLLRTLACLHGWTVAIETFSRKGNGSIVKVLSKYYFWMSCLMSSLSMGLPSMSVALKNILGVK